MSKQFKQISSNLNTSSNIDKMKDSLASRGGLRSDSSRLVQPAQSGENRASSSIRTSTSASHSSFSHSDSSTSSTSLSSNNTTRAIPPTSTSSSTNINSSLISSSKDKSTISTKYIDPVLKSFSVPKDEIVYNIDEGEENSISQVTAYVDVVYSYYKELESKFRINSNYLSKQPSLTIRLREASVDFIVQLHRHVSQTFDSSLQLDTLFLAVNIFDRFLCKRSVNADKITLAAMGCFFVATKFEETYYPTVDQLLKFVPNVGKKEDILTMERIILNDLKYTLGAPTIGTFLKRFAKASFADSNMGMAARFISEHSLLSYSLIITYSPSMIAAASISLALRVMERPPWSATLQHYTGYTYEDILPCMSELREHVLKAPSMRHHAIFKKYSESRYLKAAIATVQKI